jgi:tRNA A37 threonylcarbamoyladenosine dehydratase
METAGTPQGNQGERRPLGSIITVTAAFGLRCAEETVNMLID